MSIANTGLRIDVENNCKKLNNDRVKVITDWNLYSAILFNLIQNAIKYNKKNGSVNIRLDFQRPSGQSQAPIIMETVITDTGIGIDDNRAKYMFQLFAELLDKGKLS